MNRAMSNGIIAIALCVCVVGCQNARDSSAVAKGNVVANTTVAQAQTDRAFALIQSGKYTEAQPILERAISADPMFGPAHNDLGLVLYHLNQLYPAAVEYRNAVKLLPRQPQPRNNLGLVLESAGKLREAEQSYSQAAALDPDNTEYAGNLARVRIRLGEHDQTTNALLVRVILHDQRPQWVQWARDSLAAPAQATAPSTIPFPE